MRALVVVVLLARVAAASCPERATDSLPAARGTIHVDGELDDEVWQAACFVEDFTQKQPVFGAPPTHRVRVAIALDDRKLYVGARMWSGGRHDISDALTQRDDTSQAERFIVSLDPQHTRRLAYSFAVTARGVRADWIHTDDSEHKRDHSWNPVWTARSQLLADGWSAEMAIPLSQLRLPRTPVTSWGINFNWYIPHRNEDVFWRAVPPDRTAWASQFGELTELPALRSGTPLELLPYAATRVVLDEAPAGALAHRWLAGFEAGLDIKLRPLPDLTIAATVNPDFGQVEADPAFVNLSAYEVRLEERRPFFVENNALFANAGGNYFYSRRIAALPRYTPAADAIVVPPQVRILGAIAAGGYVARRTQIAALAAVTDKTDAEAIVDGRSASLTLAPITGWAAARVEHQVGPSVVGATATAIGRSLANTGLEPLLPNAAFVGGGDARLRTRDRTWELGLFGGVSGVTGSASAISLVQRSAAHLFQRPDQGYLVLDPSAHRLVGWQARTAATKRAGRWQGSASLAAESPRYEVNDLGVLNTADDIDAHVELARHETRPTKRVFAWDAGGGASLAWNFGGLRKPVELRGRGSVTLASFHRVTLSGRLNTPGGNDDLTRGGPVMETGWHGAMSATANTQGGRARQLGGGVHTEISPTLQQGVGAHASAALRVTPALRIDLTPSLSRFVTRRQYVATITSAGGGAGTFGARYLFGELTRTEAAVELRATWSPSPDLVLTLWAQPFVSVGRYSRIGELVAAGARDVRWYETAVHDGDSRTIVDGVDAFSIAEPDFRVASLRSTAVLRWEPSPGSTLFVVWQQARGGAPALPARPLHETLPDAFTLPAVHTLAIKLAYWFG